MTKITNKKTLVANLKNKILRKNFYAVDALLKIYAKQTRIEQDMSHTVFFNRVGFTHSDAFVLSPLAMKVTKGESLTNEELNLVHERMVKYAKQLVKLDLESKKVQKVGKFYVTVK